MSAVGAAPVGPNPTGEQQAAVGQQHLFLAEDAEVAHRLDAGENGLARGLLGLLLTREQRASQDLGRIQLPLLVLNAAPRWSTEFPGPEPDEL